MERGYERQSLRREGEEATERQMGRWREMASKWQKGNRVKGRGRERERQRGEMEGGRRGAK